MIGRGLERIGRALMRPDTFEATVAPTIADLQHEAPLGTWARVRGYASVWRVLGVSMALEIGGECAATLRAACIREAVAPALATLFGAFMLSGGWMIWRWFGAARPWHHSAVLVAMLIPGFLGPILPSIALPVAARLARARTPGALRSAALLTTLAVVAVSLGMGDVARRTEQLRSELFVASALSVRAKEADRPLWQSRDRFATKIAAIRTPSDSALQKLAANAERRRAREAWHGRASLALTVAAFALFGVGWSRAGRWTSAVLALGVLFLDFSVRALFYRVLYIQTVFGGLTAMWSLTALLFLVSCLVAVRARRAA